MRRAGRVVAEVLDLIEASSSRASRPPTWTASPRTHIRASGAIPSFKGYPGINPRRPFPATRLHLARRRDRPRDPRQPHASARARSCRSTPGPSSTAGTATPRGPSSSASRRRRVAELIDATRRGDDGRHRRRRPRQPHRGHLGRRRGRRPAAGLRHHPPVRRPRHRHRDARGAAGPQLPHRPAAAASSRPGCAWRSSRCSRSAATRRTSSPTTGPSSTRDGSLAAHFEHSIAITEEGPRDPDGRMTRPRLPGLAHV